jgi:hypothetical protein
MIEYQYLVFHPLRNPFITLIRIARIILNRANRTAIVKIKIKIRIIHLIMRLQKDRRLLLAIQLILSNN